MDVIRRIPMPLCGVFLGVISLGNLLQPVSETLRGICLAAALFFLALILLRLILLPKAVLADLHISVPASVSATVAMGLMVLSTYLFELSRQAAFALWVFALLLHLFLFILFTVRFLPGVKLQQLHTGWLIIYLGFVVGTITAPVSGSIAVGKVIFWIGCGIAVLLLGPVTARYIRYPQTPKPLRPMVCIFAAPLNIFLAAYLQSGVPILLPVLFPLLVGGALCWLFGIIKVIQYIRDPFTPAITTFTFPFVISATGSSLAAAYLTQLGQPMLWVNCLAGLQMIIASALVVYVYARYLAFLFTKKAAAQ